MRRSSVSCLALALGMNLQAQTISLRGTVKNQSGAGIPGAMVVLESKQIKTTTDASGTYTLTGGTIGVLDRETNPSVSFQNGLVTALLPAPAAVRVEWLDMAGASLARSSWNAQAGRFTYDATLASASNSMNFLRINIGSQSTTFRVVRTGGATGWQVSREASTDVAGRALAAVDSIKVSAAGYATKYAPLSSYDATVDVALSVVATCNPADKTSDPVVVPLTGMGANPTGVHQVVVETDPTLDGYTMYRPADLAPGRKYPIAAWANGACATSGTELKKYLREIASHGYVVLVDGKPNGTGGRDMGAGMTVLGGYLLKAINWAIAQNGKPCSRFYQSLDTSKLASFGASCGGLMAYGAVVDPRMTTALIMNSGLMGADPAFFAKIHTPIAYVDGGPSDIAYNNGKRDFGNMNTQPTIFANVPAVGHAGTYYNDNGGEFGKLVVAWFNWWLKGDIGATGRLKFIGTNCAFCSGSWSMMESKKLP